MGNLAYWTWLVYWYFVSDTYKPIVLALCGLAELSELIFYLFCVRPDIWWQCVGKLLHYCHTNCNTAQMVQSKHKQLHKFKGKILKRCVFFLALDHNMYASHHSSKTSLTIFHSTTLIFVIQRYGNNSKIYTCVFLSSIPPTICMI